MVWGDLLLLGWNLHFWSVQGLWSYHCRSGSLQLPERRALPHTISSFRRERRGKQGGEGVGQAGLRGSLELQSG